MKVKYRRLSSDELKELEKEFVEYLVVNGIIANDWERMKQEDSSKAERIVDLFSDVVFEGVFRKANYLVHQAPEQLFAFHALEEKIILVGIIDETGQLDFTLPETFDQLKQEIPMGLKVFQQEKKYVKQRELELFEMVQGGAYISDGQLFKQLSLLYATTQTP